MAKILGLDLGTNSIGWALINDNKYDDKNKLQDKGVLIFSEGVKKKKDKKNQKQLKELVLEVLED
jgi:CRISPR-associated endonuclease Csn1